MLFAPWEKTNSRNARNESKNNEPGMFPLFDRKKAGHADLQRIQKRGG
jgi:hypothetical protein